LALGIRRGELRPEADSDGGVIGEGAANPLTTSQEFWGSLKDPPVFIVTQTHFWA